MMRVSMRSAIALIALVVVTIAQPLRLSDPLPFFGDAPYFGSYLLVNGKAVALIHTTPCSFYVVALVVSHYGDALYLSTCGPFNIEIRRGQDWLPAEIPPSNDGAQNTFTDWRKTL